MPLNYSSRLDDDQRIAPAAPAAGKQHPEPAISIGQPWPFDRALEHAKLVPQGEDLHGQLAPRSEEGECGEEQGPDEVEHGEGAWPHRSATSMISRWTPYSGGTGVSWMIAALALSDFIRSSRCAVSRLAMKPWLMMPAAFCTSVKW
jgi:hypothetical protein